LPSNVDRFCIGPRIRDLRGDPVAKILVGCTSENNPTSPNILLQLNRGGHKPFLRPPFRCAILGARVKAEDQFVFAQAELRACQFHYFIAHIDHRRQWFG
jgi:hypothetical protein